MSEIQHYILFPNHDNAMRLYRELKKLGVRAVIAHGITALHCHD